MNDYNYAKAASLDGKARRLLAVHRTHVWDSNGAVHMRAIRRIKRLMEPEWRSAAKHRTGQRLLTMYA